MANDWNDARFNWMIPARRLVVRKKAPYKDAALVWRAQLDHHKDRLKSWYGGNGAFTFDAALGRLQAWIDRFFGTTSGAVDAARGGSNTVDLGDKGFHARLWNGPLRVVQAEAGTALDGAPTLSTADKTVTNADAVLRAGDVLEWPLHAFLAECGLTAYASATFDPDGSYLLGTSVKGAAAATAPLHDNAAAMRFQMVVNLGRGAFGATEEVFEPITAGMKPPEVEDDGKKAWARGLVYAATLRNPATSRMSGSSGWEIEDYHWGDAPIGDTGNFPNFSPDAPHFKADQPMTPGWTCSPFTLFFSQYMIGAKSGMLYHGGVSPTIKKHAKNDSPIVVHYDYLQPDSLFTDPAIADPVAETTDAVDALHTKLVDAIADLSAEREWAVLSGKDSGTPQVSSGVLDKLKKLVSGKKADPKALHEKINALLEPKKEKDALPEAEQTALLAFHESWMKRVVAFPTGALPPIKNDGAWAALGQKAPDPSVSKWPDACPATGCTKKHPGMDKVTAARKALKKALDGLPEGGEDAPGFGGRSAVHGVFMGALGDINCALLDGHEYAWVKVWPAEDLMTAGTLPRSGKIAGYDPLTGKPFVDAAQAPADGQLYLLEAAGSLWYRADITNAKKWADKLHQHAMVVRPWVCTPVTGNKLIFSRTNKDKVTALKKKQKNAWVGEYIFGKAHFRGHKDLSALLRMKTNGGAAAGDGYIRSNAFADVKWQRLYVFLKETKVATMDGWYKDRAVPFPTLKEVAGEYPKVSDVNEAVRELARDIYRNTPKNEQGAETKKGALWHPWAWAWVIVPDVKSADYAPKQATTTTTTTTTDAGATTPPAATTSP